MKKFFMCSAILVLAIFIEAATKDMVIQTGRTLVDPISNENNNDDEIKETCMETDSQSVCLTKANCCYVANEYKGYDYKACVDIGIRENAKKFCNTFYKLNAEDYFDSKICSCKDYTHSSSNILKFNHLIALILISLLFN